jgi:trk system potassium uptake protein TrkA
MASRRYIVVGGGQVGLHLARTLSSEGHGVIVIDEDESKAKVVEELDVGFVLGNGAELRILERAQVEECDLFMAVTSSDEANLAASLLAKRLGAQRTVVRVNTYEDVTTYRRTYEEVFRADLLLSTQLLATTRILNQLLGFNTVDVEYLAQGKVQLRKTHLDSGSILTRHPLSEIDLPAGALVVGYLSGSELVVPTGEDRARPGDDALIIGKSEVIDEVEKMCSVSSKRLGTVVIAGGSATGHSVAKSLERQARRVKFIELDRRRAEELAAEFPSFDVVHGDATDMPTLTAEGVGEANSFVALTGHDESNLMACLLAQELGTPQITALVDKAETSSLWRKVGLLDVVSPRVIAAERIRDYIDNGYQANIVSMENGAAQFIQRRLEKASPAAGVRLSDINIPRGLIVAVVLRNGHVLIPTGADRLEVGDEVILFVHRSELATVQLFFPGKEGR